MTSSFLSITGGVGVSDGTAGRVASVFAFLVAGVFVLSRASMISSFLSITGGVVFTPVAVTADGGVFTAVAVDIGGVAVGGVAVGGVAVGGVAVGVAVGGIAVGEIAVGGVTVGGVAVGGVAVGVAVGGIAVGEIAVGGVAVGGVAVGGVAVGGVAVGGVAVGGVFTSLETGGVFTAVAVDVAGGDAAAATVEAGVTSTNFISEPVLSATKILSGAKGLSVLTSAAVTTGLVSFIILSPFFALREILACAIDDATMMVISGRYVAK
jgi:hypothetical protein